MQICSSAISAISLAERQWRHVDPGRAVLFDEISEFSDARPDLNYLKEVMFYDTGQKNGIWV
jgi:hypothetical protein